MKNFTKGLAPIPILLAAIVVIAAIASITTLGSQKETGRPLEHICARIPDAPQCQLPTPRLTPPTPSQICTKVVERIEVKYPCPLSSLPPLPIPNR